MRCREPWPALLAVAALAALAHLAACGTDRPEPAAPPGGMPSVAAAVGSAAPGAAPTARPVSPTATPRATPAAGGACEIFPANNVWHADVSGLPVRKDSKTLVASIGNGSPVHADFGSGTYGGGPIGIPITTVP